MIPTVRADTQPIMPTQEKTPQEIAKQYIKDFDNITSNEPELLIDPTLQPKNETSAGLNATESLGNVTREIFQSISNEVVMSRVVRNAEGKADLTDLKNRQRQLIAFMNFQGLRILNGKIAQEANNISANHCFTQADDLSRTIFPDQLPNDEEERKTAYKRHLEKETFENRDPHKKKDREIYKSVGILENGQKLQARYLLEVQARGNTDELLTALQKEKGFKIGLPRIDAVQTQYDETSTQAFKKISELAIMHGSDLHDLIDGSRYASESKPPLPDEVFTMIRLNAVTIPLEQQGFKLSFEKMLPGNRRLIAYFDMIGQHAEADKLRAIINQVAQNSGSKDTIPIPQSLEERKSQYQEYLTQKHWSLLPEDIQQSATPKEKLRVLSELELRGDAGFEINYIQSRVGRDKALQAAQTPLPDNASQLQPQTAEGQNSLFAATRSLLAETTDLEGQRAIIVAARRSGIGEDEIEKLKKEFQITEEKTSVQKRIEDIIAQLLRESETNAQAGLAQLEEAGIQISDVNKSTATHLDNRMSTKRARVAETNTNPNEPIDTEKALSEFDNSPLARAVILQSEISKTLTQTDFNPAMIDQLEDLVSALEQSDPEGHETRLLREQVNLFRSRLKLGQRIAALRGNQPQ